MGSTTRSGRAGHRNMLRRHPLTLACATALLLAAGTVQAQDAPDGASATATASADQPADQTETAAPVQKPKELKSVKVVGIRRGIEDAIDTKKSSTSIVESISAEDIGKLPDVSIAESLSRLPGLAAQRVAGRAQVISVRGLSPDFATTLLNGRELVSTGDNRSVEFDQYPSELMAGVTVYKTPDAGLVGQGLSGTIDMRTVRPLDFAEPVVALSARYTDNSLGSAANADGNGNRLNASWITQNADRSVGFAIGYSHSYNPTQENQVGTYEPWFANPSAPADQRPGIPVGVYITDGIKALRRTGYTRRDAILATLQFRPSEHWESTLDAFYTRSTQEDTANQWESHLYYNGNFPCSPACAWTNVTVDDNNTLQSGTVTSVYPLVRGMYDKRKDKIQALGWNNKFDLGSLAIDADLSWSKTDRDEILLENNTQLLPSKQLDTLTIDFNSDDFSMIDAGRDYSDPTKLFLTGTIYGSGYGKTPTVTDRLSSFKLNANLPLGGDTFSSLDFGFNYADREKEKHQPEGNINLGPQGDTTIPDDLQYGNVSLNFAGLGDIPSWNVPEAVARFMTFSPNEDASYLVSKAWTVNEQITSAWFKANIDTTWGDVGVRGNIGVQAQHVDQSSDSFYWDGTQPAGQNRIPFSDGKTYTDWLPSLNLAFSFSEATVLRTALARQVARPRLDQLRSSLEFGVSNLSNTTPGTLHEPGGSGGNPTLDPWKADAFDISLEHYFQGTKGYVAAAFYYKDLKTYIFTESRTYDFTQFIETANLPVDVTTNFGQFTAPYNGNGGNMHGLELTASIPFELFSETLRGFGVQANATFNSSSITIPPDPNATSSVGSAPIDLPGLSKHIYNFTAYYSNNGFEVRANNRQRSDFIGEISSFSADRTLRYVEGENIWDAQVSYQFAEGSSLHGLSLLLQGSNLTNEHYRTYAGERDRPLENIEWGRTILFGATYKF
jgi:iron complex outermembrane receptor protein